MEPGQVEKQDNLSLVLHGVKDIRLESVPIKEPKEDEVRLSSMYCGMCCTDVHLWKEGALGEGLIQVKNPIVLGHEGCGIVEKVGSNVRNVKVGDRVAVEVIRGCGMCPRCKEGRYNICPNFSVVGIPPFRDGMLTGYPIIPAVSVHKIPDNVSSEEGVFIEPLAVVVHCCFRANIRLGDTVLVTGAGPIGLMSIQTAKAMGALRVGITDLCSDRLELAKKLGADFVVHVKPDEDEGLLAEKIIDVIGKKCDVTLECSGASACVRIGIRVTRHGGNVTIVGIGQDPVELPLFEATLNETDIRGGISSNNCFPLAIQLVSLGKVDVKSLITHRFALEQCMTAFNMLRDGEEGLIKCIIHP